MALPSSGAISFSDINTELGRSSSTANTSLASLSNGTYATINTNNASSDRPDGATPHSMSEWYSYCHAMGWSNLIANFTLSGTDGATTISPLKTTTFTCGSGNTTMSRTTNSGGAVVTVQYKWSTTGDPGTGSSGWTTISTSTASIAHSSGNLYIRIRAIHSAGKDGTGATTFTLTNSGVSDQFNVTFSFFGGGGGGFP